MRAPDGHGAALLPKERLGGQEPPRHQCHGSALRGAQPSGPSSEPGPLPAQPPQRTRLPRAPPKRLPAKAASCSPGSEQTAPARCPQSPLLLPCHLRSRGKHTQQEAGEQQDPAPCCSRLPAHSSSPGPDLLPPCPAAPGIAELLHGPRLPALLERPASAFIRAVHKLVQISWE